MSSLLSSSLLKSGPTLGTTSASSLVKSAATLQNELNTYQDTVQKVQFENNPNDASLNTYLKYLQTRVKLLNSTGSITDATKAVNMTQQMRTAISSNTSFNIQNESIQVLAGTGTDQQKLDYISSAFQRAQSIGDTKLAQSLESQAYNLQQSIQYHAQAQATANEVAYTANEAAIKSGYTNAIDALNSSWKTILTTFKNGGAGEVNSALQKFTKEQAPIFKSLGVNMPQGVQLTLSGVAQAVLSAQHAFYENGATALGTTTLDGQAFMQKAQDIVNGNTKIDTPAGSMNLFEINRWSQAPSNLYTPATDQNGSTSLKENAVSGYTVKNGQVIPQTTGTSGSTFDTLPKTVQNGLKTRLTQLGFDVVGSSNGNLKVQLTNQTAKWMGMKNSDLTPGTTVTLVSTNGGKGFQLLSDSGKVYGISFDNRGLAALYSSDANGAYHMVQGQYGFNPNTTKSAVAPQATVGAGSDIAHFFTSTIQQHVASAFSGPQRGPQMTQRAGGGFNFINANGQAISAATYAHLTGQAFRGLLQTMANRGDTGARQTLGFVGNDFKYDPTKISSGNNANLYNAMTWGSGLPSAHVNGPNISGGQLVLPSGVRL
jgi:hypothetical protein